MDTIMRFNGGNGYPTTYPRLMINSGYTTVILFTSETTGVVIWTLSGEDRYIGRVYDTLNIKHYNDFYGVIELSN
jgi:hypothetical protein